MNLNENIDNSEATLAEDQSGLAEIQHALAEIEKLKDDSETQEENAEIEQDKEEEEQQQVTSKEQEQIEKVQKKLWKEQKRKYQAIAEKEAFREENEKLKQMLNESLNSGTYHYGKSAFADLEKAKENKKKAIEEGNVEALVDADIALTKAINTVNDLEKWAYNNDSNKNQGAHSSNFSPQQFQSYYNEIEHEIASDWLENHPYLQPNSKDYNPQLANKVGEFINHLDANLAKNNQMDAYFSDQYFQTINQYISEVQNKTQKSAKNIEAASHVGGVRNSYSNNGSGSVPKQMILTADEKRMCANAGISEKDWLRYKLEDLKKGK